MYYILYIIYIYIYILSVAHTQNKQLHPHHLRVYMQRNEGDIRQDAKCNTNLPGGTTKLGIQKREQQEEGRN